MKPLTCRFPQCDRTFTEVRSRGRHESQIHGMKKGLLNGAVPNSPAPPAPVVKANSEPAAPDTPVTHVVRALAQLQQRGEAISQQIATLTKLQAELAEIQTQSAILQDAILKLKQPSEGQ